MGVIRALAVAVPPMVGTCLFFAYRMGPQLPKACRKTGNYLGLTYRYFKVILKTMKPAQESEEMVHLWNKSTIHVKTFARETTLNYMQIKNELRTVVPSELVKDPFESFRLEMDQPITTDNTLSGPELINAILSEQKRMEQKRLAMLQDKKFKEEF